MFNANEIFNDLTELPMINLTLQDILIGEPKEEDIRKVEIPDRGRGFVLYPSHLKTYAILKGEDSDLATLFLEDLMSYGITGCHLSSHPIVRALMENIVPVLDNQYAKYLEYCARDKHRFDYYNHPEDRVHATSAEQIISAMDGAKI